LGAFVGSYRYGEAGRAARQLTSIAGPGGQVIHTFQYDAAGRQTAEDGRTLAFDAADRLLRIDGLAGGSVAPVYGRTDARVKTTGPNGAVAYFFGDGTAIRNGGREHDVTVGDRVVARVAMMPAGGSAVASSAALSAPSAAAAGLAAIGLLGLA